MPETAVHSPLRSLLAVASAVVIIAGLRAAAVICVPLLLGVFFAVLSLPFAEWLEQRGVRRSLAILLALLGGVAILVLLVLLLSAALGELTEAAPIYQVRLQRASATVLGWLQERGLAAPEWQPRELVKLLTSVRLVSGHSQPSPSLLFVSLEIPLAPVDVAVPFERQNVRGDAIQKPAIVADHHHATGEVQDRFLQGSQRVDIQVVGRLVQQQQVRTLAQQRGQMDAVALAAG